MPRIYRVSPQQAEVERKKVLLRSLAFGAVIAIAAAFFTPGTNTMDSRSTLLFLLFMGAMLVFMTFRQMRLINRTVRNAIATFELEMGDVSLTKRQSDTETVTIGFSEITAIEQRPGQGTRIKTAQSNRHIWVPCELEEYEQTVEMIRQRSGAALKVQNYSLART
jgi:hypothetical protein